MFTHRVVAEEDLTPLIVHEEEEGEDGDDEAGGDHHNNDQAAVHVLSHLILLIFGSDRSSRSLNVCPCVCPAQVCLEQSIFIFLGQSKEYSTKEE